MMQQESFQSSQRLVTKDKEKKGAEERNLLIRG